MESVMQQHHVKAPKAWRSYADQLEILKNRGLHIGDEKKALGYLRTIGYYRLSGYLYSFRRLDPNNPQSRLDEFIPASCFEDVKKLYMFDKQLRQLALDALERIEIALRVNIAHTLGKYDPLAYKKPSYFDANFHHTSWLGRHDDLIARERETGFVKHHLAHYADLPVWAACEVWDFGTMSMLYKGMQAKDKNRIAKFYRLKDGRHLQTHLHAFNIIRNISAHHSRLWNRDITIKASLKGLADDEWKVLSPNRSFVYFCLMKRMLDVICPASRWGSRFLDLLKTFPIPGNGAITLQHMGVVIEPEHWHLWRR